MRKIRIVIGKVKKPGIQSAIKSSSNGPVLVLSRVSTENLEKVLNECKNLKDISIEVERNDINRLRKLGIALNKDEFNAYFCCDTIDEASPRFLVNNGFRGILVGHEENGAVQVIDYAKYGWIYTKLKMLVKDIDSRLPEKERFKKVYTRLAYMIDYDDQVVEGDPEYKVENRRKSRNLENAVLLNKAVCLGIAETLKQTLSLVGIRSKIVRSMYNNEEKGHAYNLVNIDGIWYNADLTWDYSNIRRGIRPRFCLKSDKDFLKCNILDRPNHRPDKDFSIAQKCYRSLEIYPELEEIPCLVEKINKRVQSRVALLTGKVKRPRFSEKSEDFRKKLRIAVSTQNKQDRGEYVGKHFSSKVIDDDLLDKDNR